LQNRVQWLHEDSISEKGLFSSQNISATQRQQRKVGEIRCAAIRRRED
jgi:hypothetical protein